MTPVVVDDPAIIAKIVELAARNGLTPHDYLARRLYAIWPTAKPKPT